MGPLLRPYATIEKLLRLQDSSSTKSKENGKKESSVLIKKNLDRIYSDVTGWNAKKDACKKQN